MPFPGVRHLPAGKSAHFAAGPRSRRTSAASRGHADDPSSAWRVLGVVVLASIAVSLSSSTLNIALPTLVRHFRAGSVASTWILLSFTLPSTVLLVLLGRIADARNREGMYRIGIILFGGASLLLGFAPDVSTLLVLRVIEALASSMIMVNSVALLVSAVSPGFLTKGLGLYNASFSVAQVLGPTIGALVVRTGGWPWVFWINVPICLACVSAAGRGRGPVAESPRRVHLPVFSAVQLVASLSVGLLALSQSQTSGWTGYPVWGGLCVAAGFMGLFIVSERRTRTPLVEWDLVRRAGVLAPLAGALAFTLAQFSLVLLISLYFQAVRGFGPLDAGLRLLPLPVATALAAASVGVLAKRFDPRTLATGGMLVSFAGLLALGLSLGESSSYPHIAALLALIGLGGVFLPSNTTVLFRDVPHGHLSVVNSIRLLTQNLGLTVGTALTLTLVAAPVDASLRDRVLAGTLSHASPSGSAELMVGYRHVFVLLAVVALAGAVAMLFGRASSERRA